MSEVKPLVSIIMNCFNSSKYLRETLDSVYAQTYNNWEVIFWDNLSTDESPEIAKSYDNKIHYYRGDSFKRLGEARNLAIAKANGKYLAILDCDDLWHPSKLEKQVNIFENDQDIALIFSNYQILQENGHIDEVRLPDSLVNKARIFDSLFLQKITLPWPTVMMRADVVRETGGFADYKSVEDLDIILKIAYAHTCFLAPESLAVYRIHPQQLSRNYQLAMNEILRVYAYWQQKWESDGSLDDKKQQLLREGRKTTYYIAGLRALLNEESSTAFFSNAIKYGAGFKVRLLAIGSRFGLFSSLLRRIYFAGK